MFRLRLVPDDTKIKFMKARHWGVVSSAVISLVSLILFFYPGLNYGIDFLGGTVIAARTAEPANFPALRGELESLGLGQVTLQQFGSPRDVLIRIMKQEGPDSAQQEAVEAVRASLLENFPDTDIRRVESVGGSVSDELVRSGLMAVGLGLLTMLGYIWFRFEWQFGIGALITLVLDVTKTLGFFAITQIPFTLTSIAVILIIIGYSINDKVVVYDRIRENLRIYKKMPLRELIDLSINHTLSRTVGTSITTFLAALPLALFGGEALSGFAIVMCFGILVGTLSSIFIASPLLLLLGEGQLRRASPDQAALAAEATSKP